MENGVREKLVSVSGRCQRFKPVAFFVSLARPGERAFFYAAMGAAENEITRRVAGIHKHMADGVLVNAATANADMVAEIPDDAALIFVRLAHDGTCWLAAASNMSSTKLQHWR